MPPLEHCPGYGLVFDVQCETHIESKVSIISLYDSMPHPYSRSCLLKIYIDAFSLPSISSANLTHYLLSSFCQDLMRMGINNRGHRNRIMQLVESLPPEDIEEEVPVCHCYSAFYLLF